MSSPLKWHPTLSCVYLELLQRNTEGAPQTTIQAWILAHMAGQCVAMAEVKLPAKLILWSISYLSKKMFMGGYGSDYPFREKGPWMVADSYGQMELITSQTTGRTTNLHRRILDRWHGFKTNKQWVSGTKGYTTCPWTTTKCMQCL